MKWVGGIIGGLVFAFFAAALLAAGVSSDDRRCYSHGGHWTAHGFGFCVDDSGKHVHYH